jgi:hypothetical protein
MASELKGLRIAFLTSNEGVEQAELTNEPQAGRPAGLLRYLHAGLRPPVAAGLATSAKPADPA